MVSVVVVSWNSERFIADCLTSIKMQSYNPIEIIVVDNGSEDRSIDLIKQAHKEIKLIKNNTNMGFCHANNQGLTYAQGDYIFFLNADVILEKNYVREALNPFKIDEHIGMVSGKILRFDRKTIDSTGQFLSRARRAIERGYGEPDSGQYEEEGYIFSVCGAAALYRRQMVDAVMLDNEFFDEDYFAFYEDLDIGWRAHLLGWKGYYTPRAVAYHFRGGSQQQRGWLARFSQFSQRSTELKFHILKNRYATVIKNDTLKSFILCLPWFLKWELFIYGYLLFFDAKVLFKLISIIPYLKKARQKRRLLREKIKKIKAA
jgi:GT2 family glycosyltransferase